MKAIADFSLQGTGEERLETGKSRLMFQGRALSLELAGVLMEAQYRCCDKYLLLLTNDCPYEELLHLYLLGSTLELLDKVEIGAPYTSGVLSEMQVIAENELEFSFPVKRRWVVRVHAQPARKLPRTNPAGIRRSLYRTLSKQYFEVVPSERRG